jgi:predicted nucleotidyltransferase
MGAADFLFTPPVQRVLAAALAHPEREYTLQDLLARAAAGRGGGQKQIEGLLQAGILKEGERRGRQRSIRANTEHFLYPELRSIARKSFALAEPLAAALQPFAAEIASAFVFGSVAKGTDTERSDVDLMVIGNASLLPVTEALHTTEQELGRAIHLSLYAPEEWRDLVAHDPVVAQIANGPRLQVLPDAKTS